jgi:DegV family protein with EDD domain
MFASWHNARRAAQQLSGDCEIALVDSQTLCVGQGILVKYAAELLPTDEPFEAIVRKVRGAVDRIYGVYYVENVNFLIQNKLLAPSHGILSSMLGVKPFLAVEDGRLMAIEKVRTRSQAIERVAEFVVEFEEILEAVIIQPRLGLSETTRMLQDRLAVEFPDREFQHSLYAASLAALIGADANGFVLLEDEIGHLDHDTEED